MYTVDKKSLYEIVRWASLFGTGGWIPYHRQKQYVDSYIHQTFPIYEIDDFKDDDIIVSIWWMWPSNTATVSITELLYIGIQEMKKLLVKPIVAVYPCEANIEWVLFDLADRYDTCMFDADRTWWRAIPQLFYSNFLLDWLSLFPLVAVDMNKNIYVLKWDEYKSYVEVEDFLRDITTKTQWPLAIIDHPLTIKDAKKTLTLWIMKQSLSYGQKMSDEINFLDNQQCLFHAPVEIIDVNLYNDWKFLCWVIGCRDIDTGECYESIIQNENMILKKNGKILYWFPDLITFYDKKNRFGLHNSSVCPWDNVEIIALWSSEKRKTTSFQNIQDIWRSVCLPATICQ